MSLKDNLIFRITCLNFRVTDSLRVWENDSAWDKFVSDNSSTTDIELRIEQRKSLDYQVERYELSKKYEQVLRYGSDILLTNREWNICTLLSLHDPASFSILANHIFYSRAVYHNMIQCHSSLVDWKGKGILFLGPSGIGKTTQAELWNKYRDAIIINGDIVFVQETPDAFLGWGTPWHGSSPYCENTNVPVCAMVVLKQTLENSIRELTGFEKVTAVSNSVFYPRWLENGIELCLETLDHLLAKVPVYELSYRPDEDAVRLTEETIFKQEK